MIMKVTFPGNKKVQAEFSGYTVLTDQRREVGGESLAPAPFEYFLASIGTCAGAYINGFCASRGLSTEGIELEQTLEYDQINQKIGKIKIDIMVPESFPEKYRDALVKSANMCAVKKTIQDPPVFEVQTVVNEPIMA